MRRQNCLRLKKKPDRPGLESGDICNFVISTLHWNLAHAIIRRRRSTANTSTAAGRPRNCNIGVHLAAMSKESRVIAALHRNDFTPQTVFRAAAASGKTAPLLSSGLFPEQNLRKLSDKSRHPR